MKAKKWLTIITLLVSIASLISAFLIGKDSNCIIYDIAMALLGSAVLGFVMSITEYFVERRKAMEEFWIQASNVLRELKKIKYLDEDAPMDLILAAFSEERSNEWGQIFATLYDDNEETHDAKDNLIAWYEEHIPFPFDENTDTDKELEDYYKSRMEGYKQSFKFCMDSYQKASTVELGFLDNAYGNLDFILSNCCIRKKAFTSIYEKLRTIVIEFKSEAYHFNMLDDGKGNFPVCASKVSELNKKYFLPIEDEHGYGNILVFQSVFDDIDESLEKFRCKIYGVKYVETKREPILGKMIRFGEDNG